jgi:hypothetical protein
MILIDSDFEEADLIDCPQCGEFYDGYNCTNCWLLDHAKYENPSWYIELWHLFKKLELVWNNVQNILENKVKKVIIISNNLEKKYRSFEVETNWQIKSIKFFFEKKK